MIFYTNIYIHKICISRNISKNNKDIVTCIKDIFRKYMESFENKIIKIKKDIRERNKYKNLNRKRSRYDDRWRSKGARGFIFPPRHGEGYEKGVKKEMKGLRGGKLSFIKEKLDRACRNAIFRRIHLVETFLPWEKIQSNPEGEEGR